MNKILFDYVRQEDFFAQEGIVLTEEVKALRKELMQERISSQKSPSKAGKRVKKQKLETK